MNRKKFFTKLSLAFLGLTIIKINPAKFFNAKSMSKSNPVKLKVNKLAVKREITDMKNV